MKLLLNESLKTEIMQGHQMAREAHRLSTLLGGEHYPMPELKLMKLQIEAEDPEVRRRLLAFAAFCDDEAREERSGLELLLPESFRLGLEPITGQS